MEGVEQQPTPSSHAATWLELYNSYWYLAGRAEHESDPATQQAMQESAELAQVQMEFYEDDEATVDELQAIVDYAPSLSVEPEHQETERKRQRLLTILDDPRYHTDVITPASIQAKLDSLPAPVYAPGFNREVLDVARYALRHGFGRSPQPVESSDPEVATKVGANDNIVELPPASNTELAATPESERPPLAIKVYKDLVLEFPDGSKVPLRRKMALNFNGAAEEDAIAAFRLDTLAYIGGLSERVLTSTVWSASQSEPYNKSTWDTWAGEWLENLCYQELPLVEIYKPSPDARRRYYGPGAYNLSFEHTEESSGYTNPDYFALPNGKLLGPRDARMMNLLMGSTADTAVTESMFNDAGVVSAEERAKLKNSDHVFSGSISTLRQRLRESGLENQFIIHTLKDSEQKGPTNRPVTSYWLEVRNRSEEEIERDTMIHNVAQLFLSHDAAFTSIAGLNLDVPTLTAIIERHGCSDPTSQELPQMIDSLRQIVQTKTAETLMDTLPDNDPTYALLEVILELAGDESKVAAIVGVVSPETSAPKPSAPVRLATMHEIGSDQAASHPGQAQRDEPEQDLRGSLARQIDIDVRRVTEPHIDRLIQRMDDLGIMNPSVKPTAYNINQEFNTHYKGRQAPPIRKIIFDIIQRSVDFHGLEVERRHRMRMLHGVLGAYIDQRITEYQEERIRTTA